MKKTPFIVGFFLFLAFYFSVPAQAGTVLSSYKYAWSNNGGYVNFEDVVVNDSSLTGFAWSNNFGWIKFDPAQGGVTNDGQGDLSGYAWGENLGWINFDGVTIDKNSGRFSGQATGDVIGTINFDCPNYCDVRTDWLPSGGNSGGGGGGGGRPIDNTPPIIPHVETYNEDLTILPVQSGRYTQDVSDGQVMLAVPASNVPAKTTFFIVEEKMADPKSWAAFPDIRFTSEAIFNVSAKDQNNNPVNNFFFPVEISLPVPESFADAENVGVYWLNEANRQWVLIPDAVFSGGKASIKVRYLTRFAVFGEKAKKPIPKKEEPGSEIIPPRIPLPVDKNIKIDDVFIEVPPIETKGTSSIAENIIEKAKTFTPAFAGSTDFSVCLYWWILFLYLLLFIIFLIILKRRRKKKDEEK